MTAAAGLVRRVTVLSLVGLVAAGCGSWWTGTGPGSVSGTVGVSAVLSRTQSVSGRVGNLPMIRRAPVGAPRAAPDEVLVKFNPGVFIQAAEIHQQVGTVQVKQLRRTGVTLVRIVSGESLSAVLVRYRSDPRVAYAEPNYYRYLDTAGPSQVTPNDPRYAEQWNFTHINLPAAWNIATGSGLVIVAAIDRGILPHEDLSGVVVGGYDFADRTTNPSPNCANTGDAGHGTAVAGIIAAATNNGVGVAGVNWGGLGSTRIMPLQIFEDVSSICSTTSARIIEAIEYAADHSARVINMSFGGEPGDPRSQAEQDAVNYAYNTGVVLVASAGNHGVEICTPSTGRWPVGYNNVVGVAATTIADARATYSNYGACIDLAAPGGNSANGVLGTWGTTASPSQYVYLSGTSFAAPHVSGLAALMISRGVTGPAAIQSIMQSTATNLSDPGTGAGLINAGAALGAPAPTHPMKVFGGTLAGNTITVTTGMVNVTSAGSYLLTDLTPGTWTLFAWQDANGSGTIDAGDLYAARPGVYVSPGTTTTGVNVSVTEVPLGTPPKTLAGTVAVPP